MMPAWRAVVSSTRTRNQRKMGRRMTTTGTRLGVALLLLTVAAVGCSRRTAPVTRPTPPTEASPASTVSEPPPTVSRLDETVPVASAIIDENAISARPLEDLNRNSPLSPVFFASDSSELDETGRTVAAANARILTQYPTWDITIEGHCDERGTAEYNLALGDLRAAAVKAYLVSLGIAPNRILTISYGKEFAFDSGHDEAAWAKNRRAHFVITSE